MKLHKTIDGNEIQLKIMGELDSITAPEVRVTFDEVVESKPAKVVLDLSSLRVIDSSGVGAIVSLFKRLRSADAEFAVEGVQGQPLSIFKVLRLNKVFGLAES